MTSLMAASTNRIWKKWCCAISGPAAAKSLQLCPTLCYPIDGSPPGSHIPGILQARTLEWAAIFFSNAWKWKVKVKSLSRAPTLSDPMDCSSPRDPLKEWTLLLSFSWNICIRGSQPLYKPKCLETFMLWGSWSYLPEEALWSEMTKQPPSPPAVSHLLLKVCLIRRQPSANTVACA